MTGLTSGGLSVGPRLQHSCLELALVWIGMATGAAQVLPVIDHAGVGLKVFRLFVAVTARNRYVSARKREMRFFVPGQRKRGRLVALEIVAAIAGVEIGGGRELRSVFITVAVGATLELDLEQRVLAFWNVALRALQSGVPALQGIC